MAPVPPAAGALRLAKGSDKADFHARGLAAQEQCQAAGLLVLASALHAASAISLMQKSGIFLPGRQPIGKF